MVVLVCAAVTQWNGAALAELGGACRLDGVVCWQRGGAVCVCVQQSGRWERAKLGEVPCHKCTHVTVTVCPWFVFRLSSVDVLFSDADDESDGKNISCCLYFLKTNAVTVVMPVSTDGKRWKQQKTDAALPLPSPLLAVLHRC